LVVFAKRNKTGVRIDRDSEVVVLCFRSGHVLPAKTFGECTYFQNAVLAQGRRGDTSAEYAEQSTTDNPEMRIRKRRIGKRAATQDFVPGFSTSRKYNQCLLSS
jgi:hypothetical protein